MPSSSYWIAPSSSVALTLRLAELEELLRDDTADVVLSRILVASPTIPIPEEARGMLAITGTGERLQGAVEDWISAKEDAGTHR